MTNPQSSSSDPTLTEDYQIPLREPSESAPLPDPDRNLPVPRQSHIISSILSPAVRLWLRSQVQEVDDLYVSIEGGDRQILSGLIPRVTVSARNAIYQGLYLSQVRLVGRGIKVNLGQILRGRPLRLGHSFTVQAELILTEDDLNASFDTPLLANVFSDLLINLLRAGAAPELVNPGSKKPIILDNFRARIDPDLLTLGAEIISATQGTATPFVIRTGLRLGNGSELLLQNPEWLPTPKAKRGLALDDLDGFPLDLGTDVEIQDLLLEDGRLVCRGKINIIPEDDLED
ncbi:MAG TPA: DUF2993 domain-containing protein [Synechococcales cyanobacterium M55_K2018_004]|nr:DUF2993 domain-containing protein [Synechococcales cyanobacterium M55_K2018_004]